MNKPRHKTVIFCKACGAKRTVTCSNYARVTLCIKCYDKKRRQYNSDYVKRRRAEKRLVATQQRTITDLEPGYVGPGGQTN